MISLTSRFYPSEEFNRSSKNSCLFFSFETIYLLLFVHEGEQHRNPEKELFTKNVSIIRKSIRISAVYFTGMGKKYDNIYTRLKELLDSQLALNQEQTELFCSKYEVKETKRNELLLQPGQVCPYLYFINKGCLRTYLIDLKGNEATRYLATEGRYSTAFPSFILQEPSNAYIQSIEPSELLCITYKDFRELLDIIPGYERLCFKILESEFVASIKRIESFILLEAKDRYHMLLNNDPEMILRLPSRIIADYLGISQETLSRLKSKI